MNARAATDLGTRLARFLPAAILLLMFAVILTTFTDYGITWDESLHKDYGNLLLAHFKSGLKNNLYLGFRNLYKYGGAFDLPVQFIVNLAIAVGIERLFEIRHLLNAIVGLLSLVYVYRTAHLLSGRLAGIIALLFIILTPRYYGHIFNNPKDIPFALGYIMSLFYFLKLSREMPRPSTVTSLKTGLAVGYALAIRIGGIFLFAILIVLVVLELAGKIRFDDLKSLQSTLLEYRPAIIHAWVPVPLTAWLFMLLFWPYAARSPVGKPLEVLLGMSHFPWSGEVFFRGEHLLAQNLPRTYLPLYSLITLPEFQLLAVPLWPLSIAPAVRTGRNIFRTKNFPVYSALLTSIVLPPLVAIILKSTLYDGLRHFLFLLPPLAVLNGSTIAWFFTRSGSGRYFRVGRVAFATLLILLATRTVMDMITLHPYQSVYYNRLFGGGLKEASNRYETDYWGNSYREGTLWLKSYLHRKTNEDIILGNRDKADDRITRIALCVPPVLADYYLNRKEYIRQDGEFRSMLDDGINATPDLFRKLRAKIKRMDQGVYTTQQVRIVSRSDNPDYFIAFSRWNCDRSLDGEIIHAVERQKTPLLVIKKIDRKGR